MGRSLIADESIENQLFALFGKEKVHIGLLIGQLTQQKDYIVHVARTPKDDGKELSLKKLDDKWIAHHATQVLRMLPGGLSVVGIFVIAAPDPMKAAQAQLRQTLFTIEKKLEKIYPVFGNDENAITDRILLQVCSVSKKLTCRSFDVADNKSVARPGDWRYGKPVGDGWLALQTRLALTVEIPVSLACSFRTLESQIQGGLMPTCQRIQSSLCVMNGELTAPDASLDALLPQQQTVKKAGGGKAKSSSAPAARPTQCDVKLLYKHAPASEVKPPKQQECLATLTLRGSIAGRAFVHSKAATAGDAQQALKQDLCRSLLFRCQLLCEDLLQSEEEQDPSVVYECPIRVFAPVPGSAVQLCDYLFQDEGTEESVGRFKEVVDLSLKESDIDTGCERVPDDDDLSVPVKILPLKQRDQQQSAKSSTRDRAFNMIGPTIGGMVAFLAAGLSYMYLGQD